MKTKLFTLLVVVLCVPSVVLAHKPLLTVEDNEDGTIYVETGFSDGSSGSGHKIVLRDKASGEVLSEYTIPEEGYMEEIPIPNVPYTVSFDAGPGHVVVKDGPFLATEPTDTTESEIVEEQPEAATEETVESEPETATQPEPIPTVVAESAQQPVQPVQQPAVAPPSGITAQPMPVQMPVMATAAMSPGVDMALKMMMTSQMITALGVLIVLGAVMFIIGYVVGKDARKTRA